jgi:hypothetical protein
MALQTIDIGTTANDGTGDTIRDSFDKVNDNFGEVLQKDFSILTAATTPLAGTEEIAIVQGGETKRVAVSDVGGGSTKEIRVFIQNNNISSTVNTWQSWALLYSNMLTGATNQELGTGDEPNKSGTYFGNTNFYILNGYKKLKKIIFSINGTSISQIQFLVFVGKKNGNISNTVDGMYIVNEVFNIQSGILKTNFEISEHSLDENSVMQVFFRKTSGATTLLQTFQIIYQFD